MTVMIAGGGTSSHGAGSMDMYLVKIEMTFTPAMTPSNTETPEGTPVITFTPTFLPTGTLTGTPSMTPSVTVSCTAAVTATLTPAAADSPVPTPTRTATAVIPALPQDTVWAFPNPFSLSEAPVKFINVPEGSRFHIYTISGESVRSFTVAGVINMWDGKNHAGSMVSPGVYYYVFRRNDGRKSEAGKLFVVR